MNPEYPICVKCKINTTCHPALNPVIIGRSGDKIAIRDKHKHIISTWCGNYTCGVEGERKALATLENDEPFETITVTELSGEAHETLGKVFETSEKRTARLKHRMISPSTQVYAYQDDMYYATQRLTEQC